MAYIPPGPAPSAPGPAPSSSGGQAAGADGYRRHRAGSLLAFAAVLLGSIAIGLACGLLWAGLAPRAVFAVTGHGVASLVHPETPAFIAADAVYALVALAGGVLIGVPGYLFAVRRYGPVPMAGIALGALGAAVAARWSGQQVGLAAFNSRLVTSRPGTLVAAPVVLGARSAMAFWPLAACLTAGGFQAMSFLRARSAASEGRHVAPPVPPGQASLHPGWQPDQGVHHGQPGYQLGFQAGQPWDPGSSRPVRGQRQHQDQAQPGHVPQPGGYWPGPPPGTGAPDG